MTRRRFHSRCWEMVRVEREWDFSMHSWFREGVILNEDSDIHFTHAYTSTISLSCMKCGDCLERACDTACGD